MSEPQDWTNSPAGWKGRVPPVPVYLELEKERPLLWHMLDADQTEQLFDAAVERGNLTTRDSQELLDELVRRGVLDRSEVVTDKDFREGRVRLRCENVGDGPYPHRDGEMCLDCEIVPSEGFVPTIQYTGSMRQGS